MMLYFKRIIGIYLIATVAVAMASQRTPFKFKLFDMTNCDIALAVRRPTISFSDPSRLKFTLHLDGPLKSRINIILDHFILTSVGPTCEYRFYPINPQTGYFDQVAFSQLYRYFEMQRQASLIAPSHRLRIRFDDWNPEHPFDFIEGPREVRVSYGELGKLAVTAASDRITILFRDEPILDVGPQAAIPTSLDPQDEDLLDPILTQEIQAYWLKKIREAKRKRKSIEVVTLSPVVFPKFAFIQGALPEEVRGWNLEGVIPQTLETLFDATASNLRRMVNIVDE